MRHLHWPRRPLFYSLGLSTLVALAGCSVTPTRLTQDEVRERLNQDQFRLYIEQEQIFEPIGFEQAVARALKYNMDYRLKLMESAVAKGLADLATYDMLPSLVASAGYLARNNDSGGNSINIDTGDVSLQNSTSEERQRRTSAVDFSWNALDFGMSYYRARQEADRFLIAEEMRQRVIQNILKDVRVSYWRAVGAQRLAGDAEALYVKVREALELSREAEAQGLVPPRDALNFQRLLLDAIALLAARRQDLEYAKRELAALLNITPGTDFAVVDGAEPDLLPVPFNVAELEELALINRPELREEDLKRRLTASEARMQVLSLLPNISFDAGVNYDSNDYLYNNTWADVGLQVSMNLLKPLSWPTMKELHENKILNDEARRLSLSMAVLTQVRLSVERYRLALSDLEIARESSRVDQRLADYAKAAASTRLEGQLEVIRAETRALNSAYQRHAAYATAQAAFGRIYNSVGLTVVPGDFDGMSVDELAEVVSEHVNGVELEIFPQPVQGAEPASTPAEAPQQSGTQTPAMDAQPQAPAPAQVELLSDLRPLSYADLSGGIQLNMSIELLPLPGPQREPVREAPALGRDDAPLPERDVALSMLVPSARLAAVE